MNSERFEKLLGKKKKSAECCQKGNCSFSILGCWTLYLTSGRAVLQTPGILPAACSALHFWQELSSGGWRAQIQPPEQTAAGTHGKFIRRGEMETEKLKTAEGK